MNTDIAYLDHNATTPIRPEALAAMVAAAEAGGNPSSVHRAGRAARRLVEDARAAVLSALGAGGADVVFTSGGSEANHLALRGLPAASLIVGDIEHESVRAAAQARGLPVFILPVTRDGVADLAALERLLGEAPKPVLVAVMLANNETGVIQPITEIAAAARRHGARLHCDAVQAFGKIPLDFAALGADSASVSAHKIGGPPGVGALVLASGSEIAPLVAGGQERGLRGGTENLPGIAGFGAAAELIGDTTARLQATRAWRDGLEARLKAAMPGLVVWGENAPRLPNTSCVSLAGQKSETQVIAMDLAGIAISAGAACSSGKVQASHVLGAMGATEAAATAAIRISFGWNSKAADGERMADAWTTFVARSAGSGPARAAA
ncbi:cysteine desulfurase family protein [Desertibaculum subflavum]|uniref:cysteine desulfurase family protein n=1 Tax=Desertibaculum subflavum TaxID=2268458 RepID=UPI0034D19206